MPNVCGKISLEEVPRHILQQDDGANECIKQVYPHVTAYLSANEDVAPATTRKLLDIIANNEARLKIEIAANVDVGEAFVKKTYSLDGDGPLAVVAYDYIIELQNHMRLLRKSNVIRIANEMAGPGQPALAQQYCNFACQRVQPGLEYFQNIFGSVDNLSQPLSCFKAARLIDPTRVNDLQPTAADVRELPNFPFINDNDRCG